MADLAQLVEHPICNREVIRSIRIVGTNRSFGRDQRSSMQIMITHGSAARSRVFQLSPFQLTLLGSLIVVVLLLLSGTIYHYLFQKAAREGWPVVSQIVKLVVRDEFAQRDRFMRENLDAMAQRLGEIQAKLVRLDAVSEAARVAPSSRPIAPASNNSRATWPRSMKRPTERRTSSP
jgi:Arc/MetJ-type ribon-helix-helix transcriptional regulator